MRRSMRIRKLRHTHTFKRLYLYWIYVYGVYRSLLFLWSAEAVVVDCVGRKFGKYILKKSSKRDVSRLCDPHKLEL